MQQRLEKIPPVNELPVPIDVTPPPFEIDTTVSEIGLIQSPPLVNVLRLVEDSVGVAGVLKTNVSVEVSLGTRAALTSKIGPVLSPLRVVSRVVPDDSAADPPSPMMNSRASLLEFQAFQSAARNSNGPIVDRIPVAGGSSHREISRDDNQAIAVAIHGNSAHENREESRNIVPIAADSAQQTPIMRLQPWFEGQFSYIARQETLASVPVMVTGISEGATLIPQTIDLLAEHVSIGLTALENAIRAFLDSTGESDLGASDLGNWLGLSTWVVATALALDVMRRRREQRGLVLAGISNEQTFLYEDCV